MPTLKLTDSQNSALRRIAAEHAERTGKRTTTPPGKTLAEAAHEISLCESIESEGCYVRNEPIGADSKSG